MNGAFKRKLEPLPTDVDSVEELKIEMIKGVEASKLSEAQKIHTINNVEKYLADAVWETSEFFHPIRIYKRTLELLPEIYERREPEARRVKTMVKRARFADTLSRFETPARGREVGEQVGVLFDLSPSTITRDLTPLAKAGYLERIGRGLYKLTDLGREIIETV